MEPKKKRELLGSDQAENAFKEFLDKQPNHPRRGEAKLGLGNLMLTPWQAATFCLAPKVQVTQRNSRLPLISLFAQKIYLAQP
jgi:hypothetical protein